jgi:hypothetical protein
MILYITFLELSRTLLILEFASELPTMTISNLRFKEGIYLTQRHMHRNGADLDLISQFQLYEAALKHEDRVDDEDEVQAENLR